MSHRHDKRRRLILKVLGAAPFLPAGIRAESTADSKVMRYHAIPKSGERLPVIGVGTSRVFDVGSSDSDRLGPRDTLKVLGQVSNAMLDTSPMYGEAERVSGDLSAELGIRDNLFFATKVWTTGRDAGIAQMNDSFRLLRTDRIDLMQIHNLVDWQTHLDTLIDWKAQGRIRYIGITHYNQGGHDKLEAVMRAVPLDFVQLNYSLVEPQAEQRLLPLAQEKGIAIIVNRPFARGSLFGKTRDRELPDWAREIDCQSWAQFFLKWIVSHPAVTVAIPGTSKAKHMADNLGAGKGRMPTKAIRERMKGLIDEL